MAKFEVMVTEHVQRSVSHVVNVTKKEVVDAMGLEGEDAKNWRDHVRDYCEQEWDTLRHKAERGDVDNEDEESVEIDDVTELETA